MTYTAENPHAGGSAAPGARPRYQPPPHRDLHATFRTHDNGMAARQTSCRQQTAPPQPRCRPPMPGPRLQRAATVWPERIQLPIAEQNSLYIISARPSKQPLVARTFLKVYILQRTKSSSSELITHICERSCTVYTIWTIIWTGGSIIS
jgi:hypothetical protein